MGWLHTNKETAELTPVALDINCTDVYHLVPIWIKPGGLYVNKRKHWLAHCRLSPSHTDNDTQRQ